jgi:hypothetical protein
LTNMKLHEIAESTYQVGVKAPGRPTTATFLFAVYSAILSLASGSKSKNISVAGILPPTLTAENAATEATLADKTANNAITFMVN